MKEKQHGIITKHIKYNNTITKKVMNNGYCMRTYKNCPTSLKFKSEMVNDLNQDFCGGWTLGDVSDKELIRRVINGLKPMGVIYGKEPKLSNLKHENFGYCSLDISDIYSQNEHGYNYFAFGQKGSLFELFDLESLKQDYLDTGIDISEEVDSVKDKQLSYFFDKWDTPENYLWCTGLILGYPIENTISIYKQD
jgi:hypothetical protein